MSQKNITNLLTKNDNTGRWTEGQPSHLVRDKKKMKVQQILFRQTRSKNVPFVSVKKTGSCYIAFSSISAGRLIKSGGKTTNSSHHTHTLVSSYTSTATPTDCDSCCSDWYRRCHQRSPMSAARMCCDRAHWRCPSYCASGESGTATKGK